jgi:hypothetical protein
MAKYSRESEMKLKNEIVEMRGKNALNLMRVDKQNVPYNTDSTAFVECINAFAKNLECDVTCHELQVYSFYYAGSF